MTADRWWVRAAARWLARIDSVRGHLSLAFQAMSGVGIVSGILKFYGASYLVPWFLGATAVGGLAFAYLYAEGGVWNQVTRDKVDLSHNYSEPRDLVGHRIGAQQFAYLIWTIQQNGDAPDEFGEIQEDLFKVTEEEWARLRDGVEPERVERERRGET